jgi:hypothetical protein
MSNRRLSETRLAGSPLLLAGDRVVAGMIVNAWDVTDAVQWLIRDRVGVDARRLADPHVPLEETAPFDSSSSEAHG